MPEQFSRKFFHSLRDVGSELMKIYHNSRCRKSRETLALIQKAGIEPEIIDYLSDPPSIRELDEILKKLGLEPQEIIRKSEPIYRELKLGERNLSRRDALKVLIEHPKLIERPIVVHGARAVLGRPPENVKELL